MALTILQQGRVRGFQANLNIRGRNVVINGDDKMTARVLIEDAMAPMDPDQPAQGRVPVYVRIHSLVGAVASPRTVNTFTEGRKDYAVLRYEETAGDAIRWTWFCEATRENI